MFVLCKVLYMQDIQIYFGILLKASASHPTINDVPPTGASFVNEFLSCVQAIVYRDPENIAIPPRKRVPATLAHGAATNEHRHSATE